MREIVVVMQGKIPGVATAAVPVPSPAPPAPATAPPRGGTAPEIITNWGQRCCARDIAELRGALVLIQAGSPRLSGAALTHLGRRTTGGQIATLVGQLNAALDTFANTRDATTATAALASISRQLDVLARMVTGT